jgi:hypothetical protein
MEAAKAENSRRAYRSDWRQFERWCRSHGLVYLPATPYIRDRSLFRDNPAAKLGR